MDVLISGKTSFKVEVPYKLFQTGRSVPKPLIIYLHGYGQNIVQFEESTKAFQKIEAYHLFIQGPYADFANVKKRGKWGFAWYLYNGKQGSFVKSLEYTAEFIQGILDNIVNHINVTRVCVVGYSMGAYQSGYFAVSRWKHVNDLILFSGRLKSEIFSPKKLKKASHMNVLAVHGKKDDIVKPDSQKAEIESLTKLGFNAEFHLIDGGHKLTDKMCDYAVNFLTNAGYSKM
jgi:predicted esterase